MRNANPAFLTALANAGTDGLIVRKFFYVKARTIDETPVEFPVGFWTGDDDITVSVIDGQTGELENRIYYGMGTGLKIPTIPRISDLTIPTIQIELSQLNPSVNILVREHNTRFAKADVHEGIISKVSGTLVSAPEIAFLGEIDENPIETPSAGGEGKVTFALVSDALRSLTRTNPATRSDASQRRRDGDRFNRYANLTANIQVAWGEVDAKG